MSGLLKRNRRPAKSIAWFPIVATLFLAVFCVTETATRARAQVLYGSLVGNVTDATGASVPGATVKVTQSTNQ